MNTPTIHCLHDEVLSIDDERLKPHPENPNKHTDDQYVRLAEIIQANGWRRPIRISKRSGLMTVGHGALEAARRNGWTHVPVNFQHYDDEAQEYSDMVADNALGAWSTIDRAMVLKKLPELGEFDPNRFGLKDFKLPDLAPLDERKADGSVFDRTHEQYTGSIIKQIVLFFKAEDFPVIVQRANAKLAELGLKDYSELFRRLLDEHDRTHSSANSTEGAPETVGAP